MPIVPSKLSYEELGGDFIDYTEIADPQTDLSAVQYCALSASVAAMSQTPIKVYGSVSSAGVLLSSGSVWGSSDDQPTITLASVGVYDIDLAATITDMQGNEQSLNLVAGWVVTNDGTARMSSIVRVSSTAWQVSTFDKTGAATSTAFYFFLL